MARYAFFVFGGLFSFSLEGDPWGVGVVRGCWLVVAGVALGAMDDQVREMLQRLKFFEEEAKKVRCLDKVSKESEGWES